MVASTGGELPDLSAFPWLRLTGDQESGGVLWEDAESAADGGGESGAWLWVHAERESERPEGQPRYLLGWHRPHRARLAAEHWDPIREQLERMATDMRRMN